MKMKSILALVLAVLLLPVAALCEESAADTLVLSELTEWMARYQARAMDAEPLNDPARSLTSDGYQFIYDFATLYADKPKMNSKATVSAVVITSPEEEGPRGTCIDDTMAVVLSAYYNENPDLRGSRDFAALYMIDLMPDSLQWAQVQRDGQRVQTIQYAVHDQLTTGGDGYTDAGVIYTMEDGRVSAIRVYGGADRISQGDVYDVMSTVRASMLDTTYQQVPVSYVGTELTAFGGEDLQFSGIDLMSLTPEALIGLMGQPVEDQLHEDGENGYIRMLTFESCEATFLTDRDGGNVRPYMVFIGADGMEGPRAVRVGDSFSEVFTRFRSGEGAFDGVSREVLYGDEASGTFGVAEYGQDASATLRYGLVLEDGQRVVLHMTFGGMTLTEIMLYIQ